MFTVCPKCTLTLVVTTVDLRAGQGYVRCGRCANVFNALIALREGDPGGGTADTANRRLQETAPRSETRPALGSGVDLDLTPEPESGAVPAPEPQPEPELVPEPESELETEPESVLEPETALESDPEPAAEVAAEGPSLSDEPSLEFDPIATDVSEIFISPPDAEHGTGSGNYESIVLSAEPHSEPRGSREAPAHALELAEEVAPEPALEVAQEEPFQEPADHPSHADTIAADDWSLLDDEPPAETEPDVQADDESVIEESPLAARPEAETHAPDGRAPDPPWVEQMFAEAEADAERARTAERAASAFSGAAGQLGDAEDKLSSVETDPARDGANDDAGPGISNSESVDDGKAEELEPLLDPSQDRGPRWPYVAGLSALVLLLVAQLVHFNRQSLVLNAAIGPWVTSVYGWFGAALAPRWDLLAYDVKLVSAEAVPADAQLRVRVSVQNSSDRVQPLPLLRLTLQDRYANPVATRDLEPAEYLPANATNRRLLEPNQRIDSEVRVVDPGSAAIGYEIDACLRSADGSVGCAHDARRRAAG
jgi:predicted Zn finger-like uncharacterized protein